MNIDELFSVASGKPPTAEQKKKLTILQKELRAHNNDTIMVFLGIFEAYFEIVTKTPETFKKIMDKQYQNFAESKVKLQKEFIEATTKHIRVSSKKATAKTIATWVFAISVPFTLTLGGFVYFLHDKVYKDAQRSAYNQVSMIYKFKDDWVTTDNAERALQLDRLGSLETITTCSGDGWKIEERNGRKVCFPNSGWYME